jgi:hypothetical protein
MTAQFVPHGPVPICTVRWGVWPSSGAVGGGGTQPQWTARLHQAARCRRLLQERTTHTARPAPVGTARSDVVPLSGAAGTGEPQPARAVRLQPGPTARPWPMPAARSRSLPTADCRLPTADCRPPDCDVCHLPSRDPHCPAVAGAACPTTIRACRPSECADHSVLCRAVPFRAAGFWAMVGRPSCRCPLACSGHGRHS